jgi:SAM-dependent methyltransferase
VSLPSRFPERPAVTHWNHNEHYHGFLLRQLPARLARALDVGCGTGGLACRLAERADAVDAIDVSPQMIAAARLRRCAVPNLRWLVGDVLTAPLVLGGYDAVTAVASVHHMPLEAGLSRLAELVRPGGTLAVLGLAAPSAVDYALGVVNGARRHRGRLLEGLPRPWGQTGSADGDRGPDHDHASAGPR